MESKARLVVLSESVLSISVVTKKQILIKVIKTDPVFTPSVFLVWIEQSQCPPLLGSTPVSYIMHRIVC